MVHEGNCPDNLPAPEGSSLTWLWIAISSLAVLAIILVLCFTVRKRVKRAAYLKKEEEKLMRIRDGEQNIGESIERSSS